MGKEGGGGVHATVAELWKEAGGGVGEGSRWRSCGRKQVAESGKEAGRGSAVELGIGRRWVRAIGNIA